MKGSQRWLSGQGGVYKPGAALALPVRAPMFWAASDLAGVG